MFDIKKYLLLTFIYFSRLNSISGKKGNGFQKWVVSKYIQTPQGGSFGKFSS